MLVRKQLSASELARRLGVSQPYISRRLTGETAINVDELDRIARALEVPVVALLPREVTAQRERGVNEPYGDPATNARPLHPVAVHRTPISRPRPSRPASALTPDDDRPARLSQPRSRYHA